MASPEPWDTDPQSKTGGYDFLRSYVEHMFARLREEEKTGAAEKIVYSADRSHIIWNTNLADRFGHDIILSAEVRCGAAGKEYFCLLESKHYCVSMSYECTLTIRGCNKGGCDKQT